MARPSPLAFALALLSTTLAAQTWSLRTPRPNLTPTIFADAAPSGGPLLHFGTMLHTWTGTAWREFAPPPPPGTSVGFLARDRQRDTSIALTTSGTQPITITWELSADGTWTQHGPLPRPATLHYDPALGAVVALDLTTSGPTQDHVWTGTAWNPLPAGARPQHVWGSTAADHARSRLVVFTRGTPGPGGETWEWDGTTWTQRLPTAAPPPRDQAGMAWNPGANRVVMFGGMDSSGPVNDMWEWDGATGTWIAQNPTTRPPPSTSWLLDFDANESRMILLDRHRQSHDDYYWDSGDWQTLPTLPAALSWPFIGNHWGNNTLVVTRGARTTTWDGQSWTATTAPGAVPRTRHSPMTWDASSNALVVFGGLEIFPSFVVYGDTWTFDGAVWTQAAPPSAPSPRHGHALLSHSALPGVVLFGGTDVAGAALAETWTFSNGAWTDLTSALPAAPPAGDCRGANGDPGSDPFLLADGGTEVWQWSGNWNLVDDQLPLLGNARLGMTPGRRPLLMGFQQPRLRSFELVNGTWVERGYAAKIYEWTAHDPMSGSLVGFQSGDPYIFSTELATATPIGTGCGNPTPQLYEDGPPRLGSPTFGVRATDTATVAIFAMSHVTSTVPLGSGCTGYLTNPTTVGFAVPNGDGIAALAVPLPPNAAFRGISLFVQVATFQTGGPLGGLAISQALHLRLGD